MKDDWDKDQESSKYVWRRKYEICTEIESLWHDYMKKGLDYPNSSFVKYLMQHESTSLNDKSVAELSIHIWRWNRYRLLN
jgi:hypothetical protein